MSRGADTGDPAPRGGEPRHGSAVRAVVIADTHMRRDWRRSLPQRAVEWLATADLILHAGDIVHAEVLDDLARHAPVHAVAGNNDDELADALPETVELDLAGVRVAMIHDSGPKRGRARRLRQRFPDADVVVFGHSHIPWDEPGEDGQLLFNPGSPTERRQQPHHTIGILELDRGEVVDHRIEVVDR